MIFCQVNKGLADLIREQAKDRVIVDCGCGEGLLGLVMKNIISIDIIKRDTELIDNIVHMNVWDFPFNIHNFPVFLRPCHGSFVDIFLSRHKYNVDNMLYVSKPENLEIDINIEEYTIEEISGWTGEEGEKAYLITMPSKEEE